MVSSDCSAVITDLGSARKLELCSGTKNPTTIIPPNPLVDEHMNQNWKQPLVQLEEFGRFITLTGLGFTVRWAAPEVLAHERFSLASDMWAFGWICWEVSVHELVYLLQQPKAQ